MAYSVDDFMADCDIGHEFEFDYHGIGYGIGWAKSGHAVAYRKAVHGLQEQTFETVDDMLDRFVIDGQPLRNIIPQAENMTVF